MPSHPVSEFPPCLRYYYCNHRRRWQPEKVLPVYSPSHTKFELFGKLYGCRHLKLQTGSSKQSDCTSGRGHVPAHGLIANDV
jgi:hypothetical protein